jgi:hypothetical protein
MLDVAAEKIASVELLRDDIRRKLLTEFSRNGGSSVEKIISVGSAAKWRKGVQK